MAARAPAKGRVGRRAERAGRGAPDAPICQAVSGAHERVIGRKPGVEGVTYGAKMRFFVRLGGMPCVMYGAGDVGWAHCADEHISITDLLTATETVACLLADWCGVTARP